MSQPLGTESFMPRVLDELLDDARASPPSVAPSRRTWAAPPTIWVAAVVLTVPLTLLLTAGFAIAAQLKLTAITANASLIRRMHHSSINDAHPDSCISCVRCAPVPYGSQ